MIKYVDYITPEEYMALRKKVGWMEFPLEEARNCVENAYIPTKLSEELDVKPVIGDKVALLKKQRGQSMIMRVLI